MNARIYALALAGIAAIHAWAGASEMTFQGPWKTTNRKLDGVMNCTVTPAGSERWKGRFHGVWQGVPFDYTVDFTGPLNDLRGTATIDGANYAWRGVIDHGEAARQPARGKTDEAQAPDAQAIDPAPLRRFRANFSGDRYVGSFELKEKPKAPEVAGRPTGPRS